MEKQFLDEETDLKPFFVDEKKIKGIFPINICD